MAILKSKENPIEAYAVANDIRRFDLLVEDLDDVMDGAWSSFDFRDGAKAISSKPEELEFVIVAVDKSDEEDLSAAADMIKSAKSAGLKVLLIAHDVSPVALHQLMRLGANDFAPYPLPNGALMDSIDRLRHSGGTSAADESTANRNRNGVIMPVYGVSGGVGATTFAVNLAWEMALYTKKMGKRVCILDFNFQYGSVSTFLDLPRREAIYELLTDAGNMDDESLAGALTSFKTRLAVLTSPLDVLPYDIVSEEEIEKILKTAAHSYDFVVVDLPQALTNWSETVLQMAETYFCIMEVDMRSAQNMLRFLRSLKAEDLPVEKVQYALNRAPGFADMNGKARVKRLAESLDIDINILLPDGGKTVTQSCDQGLPLAENSPKNALRKEIKKIATALVDLAEDQKSAVA